MFVFLIATAFIIIIAYRSRKRESFLIKIRENSRSLVDSNQVYKTDDSERSLLIDRMIFTSLVMFGDGRWKKNLIQMLMLCVFISIYLNSKYPLLHKLSFTIYLFGSLFFCFFVSFFLFYKKKKNRFRDDFFNFLDVFISSISAGKSVAAAFESSDILKDNIITPYSRSISFSLKKGADIDVCINNSFIKNAFPYSELDLFCILLSVNMSRGAQLTTPLLQLRQDMAIQDRLRSKLATLTAEARMSRNILAVLPVAFLLLTYFTNNTAFVWLYNTASGRILFLLCSIIIFFGVLICSRMVNGALR
ncbi:type II secretion system F family protein [Aeromonas veronii]